MNSTHPLLNRPDNGRLPPFDQALQARLSPVYARLERFIPPMEWAVHAPYIAAIQEWKRARNAIILAHNYQTPEIYYGIADFTGDSLALAQKAVQTDAEAIVMCGVYFMAETAKMLNMDKTVLIPDSDAGCSLAESITAEDVRLLKQRYPGVPVVAYVNTSVEVKAEVDICCTSGNAVEVVESLGSKDVIFLPDQYLGRWVASQTDVNMIMWQGSCEVHERFRAEDLRAVRRQYHEVEILAHPECPPGVLEEADFTGSTARMIEYVDQRRPSRVVLITECSMSDNVAVEFPDIEFIRPCNLCPHMKKITLPKVLSCLENMEPAVQISPALAERARKSVDKMLAINSGPVHIEDAPFRQRMTG